MMCHSFAYTHIRCHVVRGTSVGEVGLMLAFTLGYTSHRQTTTGIQLGVSGDIQWLSTWY